VMALLLAAGRGSRLLPLTKTLPKCLAPILGRPLLDVWFSLLERGPQPECCWLNTSYLPDLVRAHVTRKKLALSFPVHLFHEPTLLGTGGTLRALLPNFCGRDLLLAHADNLTWFNLSDFYQAHLERPASAEITMMTFECDSPSSCGIAVTDQDGILTEFHEKVMDAPSKIANGAVYLFSPKALLKLQQLGPFVDISSQVVPAFLNNIYCWRNTIYHRDIGNPQALAAAQSEFRTIAEEFGVFRS
jgi:mannose-1-phosphate guanylyltransferase